VGRNRNASVRQRRFGESGVCPDGPAEPASAFGEAVPEERGAVWTGHTGRRNKLVKGPGGPRCWGTGRFLRTRLNDESAIQRKVQSLSSVRDKRDRAYVPHAEPCCRIRVWMARRMDDWRQNTSKPPHVHTSVPVRRDGTRCRIRPVGGACQSPIDAAPLLGGLFHSVPVPVDLCSATADGPLHPRRE